MADTVSSIRINTKLITDGLKKDKQEIERQLRDLQKNAQSVSISKEIDKYNKSLEQSKAKIKDLEKSYQTVEDKTKSMKEKSLEALRNNPEISKIADDAAQKAMDALPKTASDEERSLAAQDAFIAKLNEINEKKLQGSTEYQKQIQLQEAAAQKLEEEKLKHDEILSLLQNKQIQMQVADILEEEKRNKLKDQKQQIEKQITATDEVGAASERHVKSIKLGLKTLWRMSLSVLGIRSAYLAVRKIVSSVTDDNKELKNTIDSIWIGLGVAFEPIINGLIKGFATVLNYAFAVIQALTGINVLAKINERTAKKNAKEAGSKLASFDKSEVIKKDSGSGTTDSYLKQIELNEKLLNIIDKIKGSWIEFVDNVMPHVERAGEALFAVFNSLIDIFINVGAFLYQNVIEPVAGWITDILIAGFDLLADLMEELSIWLQDPANVEMLTNMGIAIGIVAGAIGLWNAVMFVTTTVLPALIGFISGLLSPLTIIIGLIAIVITMFGDWGDIVNDFMLILDGLGNFISGVFSGNWEKAWLGIKQVFAGVWNGIIDIVQSVINGLISGLNSVINALNSISVTIPDWVPVFGGQSFGLSLNTFGNVDLSRFKHIPQLAKGAVLPPNQPFVAMLGDQTKGRNLEAPESLIRKIVREESGSGPVQVIIKADGELGALIRLLKFEIEEEERRTGVQLVLGG